MADRYEQQTVASPKKIQTMANAMDEKGMDLLTVQPLLVGGSTVGWVMVFKERREEAHVGG
jgi:hypothetical protein